MNYERIKHELDNSPSIKLLRSKNACLVLSFLHGQFKVTQRVSIPQSEMEIKLGDYLESLREIEINDYPGSSSHYLNEWCEAKLLRKTFESGSDDPIFTLTPATEKVIGWLEDLQKREFVGTESRFLQIFSLLKEIRDNSTTDVEMRIAQLESDRDHIQQEIDQIRQTGSFTRHNQTQLQERFQWANQVANQLIRDFAEIKENFQKLTHTVQEAQLQSNTRKGFIIGRVLDVDKELKESDQGRSFYTFWNFLTSETKRQELKSLIEAVYNLEDLRPLTKEHTLLRRIERSLKNAAQDIVESNSQLAEKMRQMLNERNLLENRRVAELITEIQRLALQVANQGAVKEDFLVLEEVKVKLVLARPLHPLETSEIFISTIDFNNLAEVNLDEEIMDIYHQFYVDQAALIQHLDQVLEHRLEITLAELVKLYPVEQGLSEIVAYLAIATKYEQHDVDDSTIEYIHFTGVEPEKQFHLSLPQALGEFDASDATGRLVLNIEKIRDLLKPYLPEGNNEEKFRREVDRLVNRVVDLKFLRELSGQDGNYEVRPILKAKIDADTLTRLKEKLEKYATPAAN
ncbi:DUF3375 family protein [Nostoc sp. UHCC 0702]|nr:DUF3375 family protein [Nostoc sp. UHCC 0702]